MNSKPNEPDITREPLAVRNPEVTYEGEDLSARAVVLFLIFLAAGGLMITGGLWGLYRYIAGDRFEAHPTAAASQAELQAIVGRFPQPRLQADPLADMNALRAQDELTLNTYGWTDQANGKIHIPIERAMDEVAATGLPVRPNAGNNVPQMNANGKN
jgi:hypothetical protein